MTGVEVPKLVFLFHIVLFRAARVSCSSYFLATLTTFLKARGIVDM